MKSRMVEMSVMPEAVEEMSGILERLEELGISYNIRKFRDGQPVIRELRIEPISTAEFGEAAL